MKQKVKKLLKHCVEKILTLLIGYEPRFHRIPFGPISGKTIYISPIISIRMYLGIDEPWIAELAKNHVMRGDVVYDIGAHIGYTCLLFSQRLAGTGEVHAFEIMPSTAKKYLQKTIEVNDLKNIFIHNVGLGLNSYTLELSIEPTLVTSIYPNAYRKIKKKEICQIDSLDHYVEKNKLPFPAFIKMDIEGAEVDCLKGGLNLIKKYKPKIVIEFHSADLLKQGYQLLSSLQYDLITKKGTVVTTQYLKDLKKFHQNILCLPK